MTRDWGRCSPVAFASVGLLLEEDYITENFMVCNPHLILFGRDGHGMLHVWAREEVRTGFWWGKPDGRSQLYALYAGVFSDRIKGNICRNVF